MSIVTVFALLMFTMLLIMLVNVGTHVDDKVEMQNSADAAGYSGGVVLARGMNALAFTNHLLADVFAVTAFLREARDRNAERLTPEVLDEWQRVAQTFSTAEFEKFARLGQALGDKVQKERALVGAFGNLSEAAAAYTLPVFEAILREQRIPEFQRHLVRTLPGLAQQATAEVARRHALSNSELQQLEQGALGGETGNRPLGVLWRMDVTPVSHVNEDDPLRRTLPAVDPDPASSDFAMVFDGDLYLHTALVQRRELAKHYLEQWTADKLRIFDRDAELSQLSNLWRIFTCAQLDRLLTEEYPLSNLPMVLRQPDSGMDVLTSGQERGQSAVNQYLEQSFQFLSVVYRKHRRETGPGVFRNPLAGMSDAVTFAQISLFVPRPRHYLLGPRTANPNVGLGGTFGFDSGFDLPEEPAEPINPDDERWATENWPRHWDLLNQNWMVQLSPATAPPVPTILQTQPPAEFGEFRPPLLGDVTIQELKRINTH